MRLIRRQITPVIVGIGQGTLQSIGALQLGSAGFVEYPIVGARRGAGIIGGGQVGDIRSGIAPACRIGSAMQVSGKRFQAVFPPVGLWALAGVQRLPMEAAGCFTATAPRLLVGGADDQNRASCRDRPPHSAAAPAWRMGKADIMLHELGAGRETGHGYRLQRRPAPFHIGQQVIHGVERTCLPGIIQTALDPGAAAPQGVAVLRLGQTGGMAVDGEFSGTWNSGAASKYRLPLLPPARRRSPLAAF